MRPIPVLRLSLALVLAPATMPVVADSLPVAPFPDDGASAALAEASSLASRFQQTLTKTLMSALAEGGPPAGVEVCAEAAPRIAATLEAESGWTLTRVGTRVRNPATGTPDAWEQARLAEFEQALREGADPTDLFAWSAVAPEARAPGRLTQRYMRAIVLAPACLACHGAPERMTDETHRALETHYPADRATGYRAGELRGAFSLRRIVSE